MKVIFKLTRMHKCSWGCNLKADYVRWLVEFSALAPLGGVQARHVSHSPKHNLLICVSRPLTGVGYVSVFVMGMDSSHMYECMHVYMDPA